MKYDSQIAELKTLLPTAKNILIAIPTGASIDTLASGLALFLTLEAAGKEVIIVSDDNVLVSQAHLFGVDHIQKTISLTEGGNLTLTLEGVAASDNSVPALEKLDWYAQNNNLNLVFHVSPGQTFQPAKIVPKYQGGGFNLIFVIGAVNLNALGNIYSSNAQVFSGTHVANIDIQSSNTSFGQTNVLDTGSSSVSEVMVNLLSDLGFAMDADIASNLLVGIFETTKNLTDAKVSADTYMAVANCLRVGGRRPADSTTTSPPGSGLDLSALIPKQPQTVSFVDAGDHSQPAQSQQPSPEERPVEEGVISETVEPEWLTPKIFKGSSLG